MNCFKNKNILVTGGTGLLGKELVRHLLKNEELETVRIFDVDETEQFEFHHELKEYEDTVRFLLGDVRDKERLARAVEYVDIIFHTAALKHVMACEYNPFEVVKTNTVFRRIFRATFNYLLFALYLWKVNDPRFVKDDELNTNDKWINWSYYTVLKSTKKTIAL